MAAASQAQRRYIILQQAAEWFALLESDAAGEAERAKWQRWLDADPMHASTWQQVLAISGQFRSLPPAPARAALAGGAAQGRRAFAAMLVAAVGGVALWQWNKREDDAGVALANTGYDSGVGQLRQLRLPDGGILQLDTDSLAELGYNATARRIVLRRGRIHVSSAPDTQQPARPLLVQTAQGTLRALGTRFEVRQFDGCTQLSVEQGAVEITPLQGPAIVVPAGQGAQFDAHHSAQPVAASAAAPAWTRRMLLADNMRLDDFLQELGRYRHGYLGCSPEVAHLRLVGAYPLDDQPTIFSMLEASLPVRVRQHMPWWVSVSARHQPD
ncbi:Fe2+-dicitrate sensor protein [Janthinobacterium sp. BJB426]|uniref:FecR domain-containing protein n=1 Tax=Janthinobacterium sp. BJB426 TaxID=2048010 RepID=UPI000C0DE129|nr:FecR domain-containing protein [Janthinobacterium sp. BJB426]PHV25920.1 Fe2+-dicitrate sensor protein [Janthinobacterium sp. BJB426]